MSSNNHAAVAEQADAPDSNSGPAMGAGSSPAGGTHSDYERMRRLEGLIKFIYEETFR